MQFEIQQEKIVLLAHVVYCSHSLSLWILLEYSEFHSCPPPLILHLILCNFHGKILTINLSLFSYYLLYIPTMSLSYQVPFLTRWHFGYFVYGLQHSGRKLMYSFPIGWLHSLEVAITHGQKVALEIFLKKIKRKG